MADMPLDESMEVIIRDSTTSNNELKINADGSINVIVPSTIPPAGTAVFKTGSLVTTTTTADQVVLTYTVTSGKTFYLQYVLMNGYRTSLPGNVNPIRLGAMSLEVPSGTKVITIDRFHAPSNDSPFNFNLPISSGTAIRVVVTPGASNSTTWRANFGGYEI